MLGQQLLEGKAAFADAWNFGPGPDGNRTVLQVLQSMQLHRSKLENDYDSSKATQDDRSLGLAIAVRRRSGVARDLGRGT